MSTHEQTARNAEIVQRFLDVTIGIEQESESVYRVTVGAV